MSNSDAFQGIRMPLATIFNSNEDAQQLLDVARASRDAHKMEKMYAASKLQESLTLAQFYRLQLEQAGDRLDKAEGWVGKIRARMRNQGIQIRQGELTSKTEVRVFTFDLLRL